MVTASRYSPKSFEFTQSKDCSNVLAEMAGKATESVVKKTAEKGGFNIKSLPSGMYTVAVQKPCYADQIAMVAVANGE